MLYRLPTRKETALICIIAAIFVGYAVYRSEGASSKHMINVANQLSNYASRTVEKTNFLWSSAPTASSAPPRVMCMIFTTPGGWDKKGVTVRNTWSRHCDRRHFFYSRLDAGKTASIQNASEAVALNVTEGRDWLTAKTMTALAYSYRRYAGEVDWYMKADDDSYVIWRNLVSYLRRFDANDTSYHGHRIVGTMGHLPKGYNSGGGVYMLSRGAARRVMEVGFPKFPGNCKLNVPSGWEDVDMGDCLRALGIYPTETRDSENRLRFQSQSPLTFLRGTLGEGGGQLTPYFSAKYNGMVFGNYDKGERMLSSESITFHYVTPAEMIFIDSLVS